MGCNMNAADIAEVGERDGVHSALLAGYDPDRPNLRRKVFLTQLTLSVDMRSPLCRRFS